MNASRDNVMPTVRGGSCRLPCFLLPLLIGIFAVSARETPQTPEETYAERTLRQAGVSTDGAGLLAFIRGRTLSDDERRSLANKVRALGSSEYAEREKAMRDLIALGRTALPYLREAVNDPDLELSRRSRRCVEQIQRAHDPSLMTLAALLVQARRPTNAVPVLLAYLPNVEDEALEATWLETLRIVGWRKDTPDPVLLAALIDKRPLYRAAAAHVLSRGSVAAVRDRVIPLLSDANARVRYEAAAGLARFGHVPAVRELMALVGEAPFSLACRAEYLLQVLADGQGIEDCLDKDETSIRRRCRLAWESWWAKRGANVEFTRLRKRHPSRGLSIACEEDEGGGRVWEWGQAGQPCWEIRHLDGPRDVQLLPTGRVLIAEHHANRITERDRAGKIFWEHQTTVNPISCQRLPNGNTLIATYEELYELTPEQTKVFRHTERLDFRDALRLENGHVLYVTGDGRLIERDATCDQLIRSIRPAEFSEGAKFRARVEPLVNGRYLLTLGGSNRVVEMDGTGKIRWQFTINSPASATRLPNGNTIIACFEDRCILEVDRAGKEISRQTLPGRPFVVRRD